MSDENTGVGGRQKPPIEVGAFRAALRSWLPENMPPLDNGQDQFEDMPYEEAAAYARVLQRKLFDGGYTGLVFPEEYGGQGLTPAHQRIFTTEANGYQSPLKFNMSTVAIIAPTLLELGSEEQKRRHIPAILRGEEMWAQLLSEPTGGSDLAGAITRAVSDGKRWFLDGSKIWTSGAQVRDYGMCLARTDWDVPKHHGLSMFIVDLRGPGVEVRPLELADGSARFCQVFFTNAELGLDQIVGEPGQGWTIAGRMLEHERNAVGGSTIFAGRITGRSSGGGNTRRQQNLVRMAQAAETDQDPHTRQLIAEAHMLTTVRRHLIQRIAAGARSGKRSGATGAALKLFTATASVRVDSIAMELAGSEAVVWDRPEFGARHHGVKYLSRQAVCLGGGSNEMQRNSISERVLGMPRDRDDREKPFSEVRKNKPSKHD